MVIPNIKSIGPVMEERDRATNKLSVPANTVQANANTIYCIIYIVH